MHVPGNHVSLSRGFTRDYVCKLHKHQRHVYDQMARQFAAVSRKRYIHIYYDWFNLDCCIYKIDSTSIGWIVWWMSFLFAYCLAFWFFHCIYSILFIVPFTYFLPFVADVPTISHDLKVRGSKRKVAFAAWSQHTWSSRRLRARTGLKLIAQMWVFPKIMVHYFHHPHFGGFPPIFGNSHVELGLQNVWEG